MIQQTKQLSCLIPVFFLYSTTCSISQANSQSTQTTYDVAVSDISYQNVHKNWFFIPSSVDLKVTWVITAKEMVQNRRREVHKLPQELPFTYQVYTYLDGGNTQPLIREARKTDHVVFPHLKIGEKYAFKVRMVDKNGTQLGESDFASILLGKSENAAFDKLGNKGWLYYAHPGRWQLIMIGKTDIFDRSTSLGKVAFVFLSITSLLSCIILIFYSSRTLYLGNIFPFKRSNTGLLWSILMSCDISYDKRLTNKFKFVLRAWETIAIKSKSVTDTAVKSIPTGPSSTERMASVDMACMDYWRTDGDRAIGTIEDIISFPYENHMNGNNKSADDLLTELVIKIEDSFHEIIHNEENGDYTNGFCEKEDMKTLVEEIYEPVTKERKPISRMRTWVLRKGVLDLKKGLRPFPTSRIILAGLGIHRIKGYRWLQSTEEVKRAFEDRASNEIEILKRKSKIEWFWNYGALAPLVGLFGTVTGITDAFEQLSHTTANPDFVNTIQLLSNGIFEALWTTIFGLINGIGFVIIYYYYKHKLDWIYSKWEGLYVSITEKL